VGSGWWVEGCWEKLDFAQYGVWGGYCLFLPRHYGPHTQPLQGGGDQKGEIKSNFRRSCLGACGVVRRGEKFED
jgi:hypothetical protein